MNGKIFTVLLSITLVLVLAAIALQALEMMEYGIL